MLKISHHACVMIVLAYGCQEIKNIIICFTSVDKGEIWFTYGMGCAKRFYCNAMRFDIKMKGLMI